jgi:hypothetical protein
MYTVIIVALVILILVRRTDFTIWWYQLTNRHLKAGELAFQQGSSPAAAASLLTTAANQGHIEAAVPLGKLFEEADEPHNAALVYNVLEGRTRDVSPVLNAYAMERLDLLQAQRLAAPVTPVRLAVQERVLTLNPPVEIKVKPKEKPKIVVTSDGHNVHDSGLTKSLAATYEKLRAAAQSSTTTIEQTVQEVRELSKHSKKALQALDSIERSTTPVHSLGGAKEVEVLQTVWNRIKTSHDKTIQDTLVESLADSVDQRGNVVCTQGKISRIIDSLNVVDPLVSLKPRWATRTELLEMAAKLRNENPDDDTTFKTQLRERARTLYVTTGLMSQKVLDAEIDSWVDDI